MSVLAWMFVGFTGWIALSTVILGVLWLMARRDDQAQTQHNRTQARTQA
jgi:hypothetical protein